MAFDTPHASWHPALMPNSAFDLEQLPRQQPTSSAPEAPAAEQTSAFSSLQEDTHDPFDQSVADDAWFPEYEAGGEQHPAATEVAQPQPEETQETREAEAIQEAPAEEEGAEAFGNANKHLSTMSFARTVSHEFNWNDDEDTDFTLQKTEPDPFKFMPPNDRTNSFPAVPTLQSPEVEEIAHPLSANQAEDIVNEVERQEEKEEADEAESGLASAFDDTKDDDFLHDLLKGSDEQQYIGGDVQGSTAEASDARYAEGLPLVAHVGDTEGNDAAHDTTHGQDGLAADSAADDDDFFSHVQDSTETQEPEPAPLERKSTMQVLDDMGMGTSAADMATVEESPKEDQAEDAAHVEEDVSQQAPGVDLDAKWKEVFADDDDEDFLLEDTAERQEVDPAAFFGDDDEGFLEAVADETAAPPAEPVPASVTSPVTAAPAQSVKNRYLPAGQSTAAPTPTNPYLPSASPFAVQAPPAFPAPAPAPASVPPMASGLPYGAPPPRPEPSKAQSFVDKKGGYQSPYDLPMEVVKPRKRVSMHNLQRTPTAPQAPPVGPPAPPRSTSMYAQTPYPGAAGSIGSLSPPTSSNGPQPPAGATKAIPPKAKEAFFEDLPVVAKPRPGSRHSSKGMPSPAQTSPYGPPPTSHPPTQVAPPPATQYLPPQPVLSPPASAPEIPALVAPGRVSPYAPLQSSPSLVPSMPPPPSRYSPAPPSVPHLNGVTAPAPPSRYSPAPPGSRPQSAGYGAAAVGPAPPVLPHQPRTSSPLAHFEISHDRSRLSGHPDTSHSDRRGSSTYEQRLQRVPSLPPTREVEEEEGAAESQTPGQGMTSPPAGPPEQRHSQLPYRPRQTPPPPSLNPQMSLSPPKRVMSNYSPNPMGATHNFAPPQRSQTQSPGALYGRAAGPKPVDPIQRPSSVHGPTSPRTAAPPLSTAFSQPAAPGQTSPIATRPRGISQNFNLIAPTDGREHDPLQRWKGVPVITWGVGGTVVTMFPKDVPRYGMGHSAAMVIRSPGEVKVQTIKDLEPLEERLSKFPGPLKGKSKKKETIAWLSAGIETLESSVPSNLAFQRQMSHEDKRAEERILLWKILRLFVEHDGVLDGNPAVEQAVREILSPNLASQGPGSPLLTTGANIGSLATSGATKMHADAVEPSSIEELRNYLLAGDREKAVWAAADKRLWGHAMLIANTVSQDLYKKVTQEFVKKEVNSPGHNNESLAALYEVLSGNHEDCVDELVPVHARAGLQLLAKDSGIGAAKDVTEGLDKWRETLSLILSNRSADDTRAMKSLGELLSSYGRAEAAHISFIFAKSQAVFGGLDDPSSNFVLLGSDHRRQVEQFAKEAEPLLLSEVYEYGLSLAGGSNVPVNTAHLAGYKYQHALTLAEYGFKDKALQYCDAILNAIAAQTRRSPYHHALLEAAVEDLSKRLKLAPKEGSNSWIPKPSMNKVSDSVWNRFNKFVAGDDNESSGQGSPTHGVESGPFARLGGGTPTISRPPSAAGLETFGATVPGYPMVSGPAPTMPPVAPTKTASRYAPGAPSAPAAASPYEPSAYAPRSSMERTSSELNRGSFEMSRPSMETHQSSYTNSYTPNNASPAAAQGFQPVNGTTGLGVSSLSRESSYIPVSPQEPHPSQPPPLTSTNSGYQPQGQLQPNGDSAPNGTYYPPPAALGADNLPPAASSGYQPPSYGYEPPSFSPQEPATSETKPEETQETNGGGYEAPSYQPYGYEPPSYEPDPQPAQDESDDEPKPKPKKRGPMYDDEDDDDLVVPKTREKTKEEKDRENAEMFRRVAEEEAKRTAEAAKSQPKKGWLGGWFGGGKDKPLTPEPQQGAASAGGAPNKPIRAKLGEANSFHYDPVQKRWVNKNASPDDQTRKTATPPPPRGPSGGRSATATPPPPPTMGGGVDGGGRASAPPPGPAPPSRMGSGTSAPGGTGGLMPGGQLPPAGMVRSASNTSAASGPPSRPATSMSNASSIDDLLGAVGPRVKGAGKKKKGGRYVDVMAKP